MPSDKEILYSMLDREIENILRSNPMLAVFSSTIKTYIHNFLDPYLNFFMEGENLHIDMASSFANEEMQKRLESFKKNFQQAKEENKNE